MLLFLPSFAMEEEKVEISSGAIPLQTLGRYAPLFDEEFLAEKVAFSELRQKVSEIYLKLGYLPTNQQIGGILERYNQTSFMRKVQSIGSSYQSSQITVELLALQNVEAFLSLRISLDVDTEDLIQSQGVKSFISLLSVRSVSRQDPRFVLIDIIHAFLFSEKHHLVTFLGSCGGKIVSYVSFELDWDGLLGPQWLTQRFMTDARSLRQGYGKATLLGSLLALRCLKGQDAEIPNKVSVYYQKENLAAKRTYKSVGFRYEEEDRCGVMEFSMNLHP